MKKTVLFMVMLAMLSFTGYAASTPRIISCGIDPVTITPGGDFTIYADVADPDGLKDIREVGIVYGNDLILDLPAGSIPGRYEVSFTLPGDAGPGRYTLAMQALDLNGSESDIQFFSFAISDPGESSQVQLTAPEDGTDVECNGQTTFAWQAPEGVEFQAFAFGLYLPDGQELVIPLPAFMTEFTVPGALWRLLPDGTYFWNVGMIPEMGSEPIGWSEMWSFNVDCNQPWPTEVFGRIIEIDLEAQTLVLSSRWHHGPDLITVQVTEETIIYNQMGEVIPFDQVNIGDFAFCNGEFVQELFMATEIFIEGDPQPPQDHVCGIVTEIDAQARIIYLNPELDGDLIPVQVTEDTLIMGRFGPMTFEEIQLEMLARAIGEWQETVFVATELYLRDGQQPPPPGDQVGGIIENIDYQAMMLYLNPDAAGGDLIPVQVTEDTVIMHHGEPFAFEDIQIGMMALAMGEWQAEVFLAAHLCVSESPPPPPPPPGHVEGMITDIDAAAQILYIGCQQQSIPVQVTPATILIGEQGPIEFGDIQIGMHAMAHGIFEGDVLIADEIFVFHRW
ncbi:hypothetical protein JXA40_12075 [bacterium]|nr:hypothetical protein [candidate division CSSED10-310 bacterium]